MNNYLAEQSVIGGILIDASKASDVMEIVCAGDFDDQRHMMYFKAIESLIDQQKPVDIVTISDCLQDIGHAPDISYLMELAQNTPTAANVNAYAQAVKDSSTERKLLNISAEMTSVLYGEGSTSDKVERITQLTSMVSQDPGGQVRDAGSIMKSSVAEWERRASMAGSLMGYSTGFRDIDKRTMGLQAPDLTVIAAGSGKGKTTLAMNMVQAVAIYQQKPVLVFSLEMSGEQLIDRMMASVGEIPMNLIKSGKVFGSDYDHAIMPAAQKIKQSSLYIDDRGGLTIGQIQATARKFFKRHGQGLMVVDYIGLIDGKGTNKQEKTASVSGGLKSLAKELSIPVVALAQMNRNGVQRGDKRPVASDLRDSAAIEHDSDCLIMLYEDEDNNPGVMEAHFVKHRNGEVGTDYLVKRLDINRFQDQANGYEPKQQASVGGFSY